MTGSPGTVSIEGHRKSTFLHLSVILFHQDPIDGAAPSLALSKAYFVNCTPFSNDFDGMP